MYKKAFGSATLFNNKFAYSVSPRWLHAFTIFVTKKLLCESENLTMWPWIFFNSTMFGQFFKMGTNISSISLIFKALSFLAIDDHVASDFQSENLSSSWGYHGPKVSDSDFKWLYSILGFLTAFNFEPSLRKTQQGKESNTLHLIKRVIENMTLEEWSCLGKIKYNYFW